MVREQSAKLRCSGSNPLGASKVRLSANFVLSLSKGKPPHRHSNFRRQTRIHRFVEILSGGINTLDSVRFSLRAYQTFQAKPLFLILTLRTKYLVAKRSSHFLEESESNGTTKRSFPDIIARMNVPLWLISALRIDFQEIDELKVRCYNLQHSCASKRSYDT